MESRYFKFAGEPIKVIKYAIPDLEKIKKYSSKVHFAFDIGKSPTDENKIIAIKFNWVYEIRNEKKQLGYFVAEDTLYSDELNHISFDEFRRVVSNTYFRFLNEYKRRNGNKYTFIYDPTANELQTYYRIINPKFPSQN